MKQREQGQHGYRIGIERRVFHFKEAAGTSRGVYHTRTSWLVRLTDAACPGVTGVGECAPLPRLSCDDVPHYEAVLRGHCDRLCATGELDVEAMRDVPSMLFGLETALAQLRAGGSASLGDDTTFGRGEAGITINGLVWMGTAQQMRQRMLHKLREGYRCVKIKIGPINFDDELALIAELRERSDASQVELRVDANGAFAPHEAPARLEQLARHGIHSIEQPIAARQWQALAALCRQSPLPIALDEELIGVNRPDDKCRLLDTVRPAYIVLKPSLHGGMAGCREWVRLAHERGIGSWMTSALESNIGLNAVAHLAAMTYGPHIGMPQGLGTGQLFTDNIAMPIGIRGDQLWFEP